MLYNYSEMAAQNPDNEGTLKEDVNPKGSEKKEKKEPEKVLFSWKAPARPFKRRNRQFWTTTIAIAAIFGLILFLIEGVMPVLVIISIVFLFYILSTVEPEEVEYKITNKGVVFADKKTEWDDLTRFWFTRRFNNELLVFEMTRLPGRLELVINPNDKSKIKESASEHLEEEKAPPSNLDRATNWLSKRFPGN